jgi:hypothetical protein
MGIVQATICVVFCQPMFTLCYSFIHSFIHLPFVLCYFCFIPGMPFYKIKTYRVYFLFDDFMKTLCLKACKWCFRFQYVYQWREFKSRRGKNKNLTTLKSNSNTVWFNFQTYIIFSINLVSLVTLRSSGTDIL